MEDPKQIYLQPWCDECAEKSYEGRQWCDHDAWGVDDCPGIAVKYVRADLIAQARAEGERAGIERAAKCADEVAGQQVSYGEVSEKYGDEYSTALHEYAGDSARDLATAIRSLKVEGETP